MAAFPSWTRLFFKNATAPTGWTRDPNDTYDHAIRIVSSYIGDATVNQSDSNPLSSSFINTIYNISATTISPGSTNPAVMAVPPHSHTGTTALYTGGFSTTSGFTSGGAGSTSRLQSYSFVATTTGPASVTPNGVHNHTATYTQSLSNLNNNVNFSVKYTDLILAYKNPTGAKTYNIFLSQNSVNNVTTVNNGQTFTINVQAPTSVPLGKTFIYNIINISTYSNDFQINPTTGNLTLSSTTTTNNGTVSLSINPNNAQGTTRYFKYEIIDPSIGSSIYISPQIGIVTPVLTATFVNPTTVVDEGSSYTYNISVTNASSGQVVYWDLTLSASVTSSRFNSVIGGISLTVDPATSIGTGSFTISVVADNFTQGPTTTTLNIRKDAATTGTLLVSSPTITINDTSQTPPGGYGQAEFTTAGTATWTVPSQVTSITVLVIGAGGKGGASFGRGGAGGGLAYLNNITVVPGTVYNLRVGLNSGTTGQTGTGASWFNTSSYLYATKGADGISGGNGTGGGGGGAAGYAGNGGRGGDAGSVSSTGGGGGGVIGVVSYNGGAGGSATSTNVSTQAAGGGSGGSGAGGAGGYGGTRGGGGVGLYGQSSVDVNGNPTTPGTATAVSGTGSGTTNGGSGGTSSTTTGSGGGRYGGGGSNGVLGGGGAVRIIWPGNLRQYPNTKTNNM